MNRASIEDSKLPQKICGSKEHAGKRKSGPTAQSG